MGRPGALKQKPVRKHHPGGGKDLKSPAASCMSWRRASLISEAPEAHDAHARSCKDFLSIWSIQVHSETQIWEKTESPWIIPIFGGRLISKKIEELFRINEHLRIQRNPQVAYNLGLTWEKVQRCLLQQVSWSSHPISPTKRSPLAVPLGKAVGESWDFSVPKPMHLCRSHTPSYHLQGYNVPFSPANFFLSYGTSGRDRPKCPKETNNQWWARSWSHLKSSEASNNGLAGLWRCFHLLWNVSFFFAGHFPIFIDDFRV